MNLKTFDVLDPKLNLYQKYFIEASAGCGKTFSIENAYLRLLLDLEKGMIPQDILVLTFTKEATKELKMRIRGSIENGIHQLENPQNANLPYLIDILEQDSSVQEASLRALLDALANFDQAQIFTLHSFCFRMLKENLFEAHLNIEQEFKDEGPSLNQIQQVLKDFLSFQLDSSIFSSSQIRILLQHYRGDFSLLLKNCIYELAKEKETLPYSSFAEGYRLASQIITVLKTKYGFDQKKILEDCHLSASLYKGGHNREGEMHAGLRQAIQRFADLFAPELTYKIFDHFLWDASIFFKHFEQSNKKKRGAKDSDIKLFYPNLWPIIKAQFQSLIEELVNPSHILSRLIFYVHELYKTTLSRKRALTPNNILGEFQKLAQKQEVAEKIAHRFGAVIVDEFQDTDPIQWDILSSIFLKYRSKDHPFYLVGDPKQSIYAFRSADIYTYLTAAKSLGLQNRMTLDTNYRSQPHLIEALNDLFQKVNPHWIDLPKWNKTLAYQRVKSCASIEVKDYLDNKKSIHFFTCSENGRGQSLPSKITEEEKLFPFIVNEVLRLHQEAKVPLNAFALLVRDRFQGARLKKFLKQYQIPFKSTRPEPLKGSQIAGYFLELYEAVLNPKKCSKIQRLQINPIFQMGVNPENGKDLAKLMAYFAKLKEQLFNQGFLPFYNRLMQEPFLGQKSIYEHFLTLEDGLFFYLELEQIKDLLVEEELLGRDPQSLASFLQELSKTSQLLESSVMQRQNIEEDSVHILTLHMSKGLEFEIVFALGLVNRTFQKEELIPLDQEGGVVLVPSTYSKQHTTSYHSELSAEKLRQLYVALTRAKQRLYIPAVYSKAVEMHKCSPLELFLQKLSLDSTSLAHFISNHPHMSLSNLQKPVEVIYRSKKPQYELNEPKSYTFRIQKSFSHSFTSLASKSETKPFDLIAPHDFEAAEKNIHTLPAGAHTGTLYHKIMEKINFQEKNFSLEPFLENTPYLPWKKVLEENIQKILHLQLPTETGYFSLKDLSKTDIFKEVEFLYPVNEESIIRGLTHNGDYLQGFIDLICKYQNKYYLIDYKTNWLGCSQDSYSNLNEVMSYHQYNLQVKIYEKALKNYLSVFEDRPFEDCFGGSFYIFIRGCSFIHRDQDGKLEI